MLNSLLSEFGSNKSVAKHTGRIMSTGILGIVPQYPVQGHSPHEAEEPENM